MARKGGSYTRESKDGEATLVERTKQFDEEVVQAAEKPISAGPDKVEPKKSVPAASKSG